MLAIAMDDDSMHYSDAALQGAGCDETSPNEHSAETSNPPSDNLRAQAGTFDRNIQSLQACGIVAQEQSCTAAGSALLDSPGQLTSVLCHVLDSITACYANAPPVTSPFHSTRAPPMTVRAYVERVVKYSKCSAEALAVGFLLMCQHSVFSGHSIGVLNVHRLVVTAVLLGAKLRDDEYFSNVYYSRIGGVSAAEINDLELTMLTTLEWDLWTGEASFDRLMAMFEAANGQPPAATLAVWQSWWTGMAAEAYARRHAGAATFADAAAQVLQEQTAAFRGMPAKGSSGGSDTPSAQGLSPAKQRRASRQGSLSSSRGFASQNSVGSMADQFPSDPPSASTPVHMDPSCILQQQQERGATPSTAAATTTLATEAASPASQEVWTPSRVLTRQRFPRPSSTPQFVSNGPTPQSVGGILQPSVEGCKERGCTGSSSNASSPFTTQTAGYLNPPERAAYPQQHMYNQTMIPSAPAADAGGAVVAGQHLVMQQRASPGSMAGKKRSKPEHFTDYR